MARTRLVVNTASTNPQTLRGGRAAHPTDIKAHRYPPGPLFVPTEAAVHRVATVSATSDPTAARSSYRPQRPVPTGASGLGGWRKEPKMNETHVTLVGTVINDLRRRTTTEGAELVKFRIASNERRKDRVTGEWNDGETLYANVTCWRRLVGGVSYALAKGDPVIVTGRMYTRGYEVDGQKRQSVELDAATVGIDLSRCMASIDRVPRLPAGEDLTPQAGGELDPLDVQVPDTAAEIDTVDA